DRAPAAPPRPCPGGPGPAGRCRAGACRAGGAARARAPRAAACRPSPEGASAQQALVDPGPHGLDRLGGLAEGDPDLLEDFPHGGGGAVPLGLDAAVGALLVAFPVGADAV